jgi:hypothetical protein
MSERRFALVDFTYRGKTARLRRHEAGHTYALPRAVAHAATKRALVAKGMTWQISQIIGGYF